MLVVDKNNCDPAIRILGRLEKLTTELAELVPMQLAQADGKQKALLDAYACLRRAELQLREYAGSK